MYLTMYHATVMNKRNRRNDMSALTMNQKSVWVVGEGGDNKSEEKKEWAFHTHQRLPTSYR